MTNQDEYNHMEFLNYSYH